MKKLYDAPIDNKHLMEDAIEENEFKDFYWAPDHGQDGLRHLIGTVKTENYDAYVDVTWKYGENFIGINVIGYPPTEDLHEVRKEVYDHYEKVFKAWECEDNEYLVVTTFRSYYLTVNFYFEVEE